MLIRPVLGPCINISQYYTIKDRRTQRVCMRQTLRQSPPICKWGADDITCNKNGSAHPLGCGYLDKIKYLFLSQLVFASEIFRGNLERPSCCRLRIISRLQVKAAPAVKVSAKIENGCDALSDAFHTCFVVSDWRLLVSTVQITRPFSDNKTIKPLYWK